VRRGCVEKSPGKIFVCASVRLPPPDETRASQESTNNRSILQYNRRALYTYRTVASLSLLLSLADAAILAVCYLLLVLHYKLGRTLVGEVSTITVRDDIPHGSALSDSGCFEAAETLKLLRWGRCAKHFSSVHMKM
jgi:hypothetical protein